MNSKGGRNGIPGLQPSLQDRVYDSNGIATACTTSPFFMPNYLIRRNFTKTANELIFVGGIGENMWLDDEKKLSRNFKQGYRVYSSEGTACSITTNGGGLGGCTGLYLIERENDE